MCNFPFQADSKLNQIQQNPATPGQRESKEKAWISLDSLVRIEPFQGVALTPQGKKLFPAPFPAAALHTEGGFIPDRGKVPRILIFRKDNSTIRDDGMVFMTQGR
jgi:hypothetical protein